MGDSSDNIPGVKGIGEKTALKLLQQYHTLEGIYDHIDEIKGSTHDKLVAGKDEAFMSKRIATIYIDVPLDINLEDLKYNGANAPELAKIYNKLGFKSFLNKINTLESSNEDISYIKVNGDINIVLDNDVSMYFECDDEVYTNATVIGAIVSDKKYHYYFDKDNLYR